MRGLSDLDGHIDDAQQHVDKAANAHRLFARKVNDMVVCRISKRWDDAAQHLCESALIIRAAARYLKQCSRKVLVEGEVDEVLADHPLARLRFPPDAVFEHQSGLIDC